MKLKKFKKIILDNFNNIKNIKITFFQGLYFLKTKNNDKIMNDNLKKSYYTFDIFSIFVN